VSLNSLWEQRKLKKQIWQWRGVFIVTPSVAGVLIALPCFGLLQALELTALNQIFRLLPLETVDSHAIALEVNQSDVPLERGFWGIRCFLHLE
jgi:adenylate cyclase